jgi:hypothetical protein
MRNGYSGTCLIGETAVDFKTDSMANNSRSLTGMHMEILRVIRLILSCFKFVASLSVFIRCGYSIFPASIGNLGLIKAIKGERAREEVNRLY